MASINLLACANGVGISRDLSLIKSVLEANGHEVFCNHTYRYAPRRTFDLNIWLERFNPITLGCSAKNIIIPNQEWFEPNWIKFLEGFDAVFAKTQFAKDIFEKLGCKTHFISFTSEDRYQPSVKKDYFHWIHVAGKSIQKQTELVVKTWQSNPGFPQLTIVQDHKFWKPRTLCRNINFMIDRVPEDVLLSMQNASAVHVCPSETEGFGHYIMEAMSTKGVVLTTDAAPMNEIANFERGCLVAPSYSEPMNLSTKFLLNQKALEDAVVKLTIMDQGMVSAKGEKARQFFLDNDALFKQLLPKAVLDVLS
jgi:hypothetical protein